MISLASHTAELQAQLNSSQITVKRGAVLKRELELANRELHQHEEDLQGKTIAWKIEEARLLQAKDYLETRTKMMGDALQKMAEKLERMEKRCLELVSDDFAKGVQPAEPFSAISTADATTMTEPLPAINTLKEEQKRWRI